MTIDWTNEERTLVQNGIAKHGLETGRCAALARVIHPVALRKDPKTRAIQLRPPKGATWLIPKSSDIPHWKAHVYVDTCEHAVDAVTGSDGYAPSNTYVETHWEFAEFLRIEHVDPATVDPGIQDVDEAR